MVAYWLVKERAAAIQGLGQSRRSATMETTAEGAEGAEHACTSLRSRRSLRFPGFWPRSISGKERRILDFAGTLEKGRRKLSAPRAPQGLRPALGSPRTE